jgi:hypothetical protein
MEAKLWNWWRTECLVYSRNSMSAAIRFALYLSILQKGLS